MKKLYKPVLAAMLSLALVAAVVPATAFAEDVEEGIVPYGIIPGKVNVLLNEPYYSYGGPYLDLREILPEVEIESYRDLCLSVLTVQEKPIEEHSSVIVAHVGMEFTITLVEKTVEATELAAELLNKNPYVKGASPSRWLPVDIDDDPIEPEDEITVGDALKALRVAAGLEESTAELVAAYDTDGDGEITVADALTVLRVAAKLA